MAVNTRGLFQFSLLPQRSLIHKSRSIMKSLIYLPHISGHRENDGATEYTLGTMA